MKILTNHKRTHRAKVGDVVSSPLFGDGFKLSDVVEIYPEGHQALRDKYGDTIPKHVSHDITRKYAWFVVEKTVWTTRWQDKPNGWYCTARRLKKMGEEKYMYDPKGELIEFVQMESSDPNYIEWVTRVATMEHVFV